MQTVRVGYDGTLVVPPFECAWLSGGGGGHAAAALRGGSGCVAFEARAGSDITILLKPV